MPVLRVFPHPTSRNDMETCGVPPMSKSTCEQARGHMPSSSAVPKTTQLQLYTASGLDKPFHSLPRTVPPLRAWVGLAWVGLACVCPGWPGLGWPGLGWPGLAWPGFGLGLAWTFLHNFLPQSFSPSSLALPFCIVGSTYEERVKLADIRDNTKVKP